ncbi:hypothetical protein QQM39_38850 [Streptomyces sp. DT2A-34]|uniref:hypothetical protein n=1 Tax=Streptomyces sp. DT2A-34 TaxID=3051182 RepID=UPI00265C46E1|nr:hypothetical protein [Streptomyces sp. DT2A-34]MDO0916571.1 hypothetical protein [Streptomyces sp. DT2A-34]
MRPGEHASEEVGETAASAGQAGAQVAVAPAPAAPGTDADGKAGQPAGAVWDQPLPWATPQAEGEDRSSEEPTSSQAESPVAEAGPAAQAAAVREADGDEAKGEAQGDAEQGAQSTEAADNDSSVALWQAAAADQQRGAHAAPTPVGATGVAGHAVSKWLLGAAVAVGGLVAAAGAVKGMSSPPAATAKEKPEPILAPGQGLDEDGSPTPTSTTPEKKRAATEAGKAAAAAVPAAAAPGHVPGAPAPAPAHTPEATSQRSGVKSSVAGQSSYVAVQTALKSPDGYWSQSSVTVTTTKKLTALKVVLHVAQTGGVANTGVWTSLGDKVTVHAGKASDGGADYVVVLNEGITLDAGTYVFQFGYNHDKGARETVHDIWGVVTTAVGDSSEVYRNGRY